PTAAQLGSHRVVLTVSDARGATATQSYDLAVVASAPNDPPVITSTPRTTLQLGRAYLYAVQASDPNRDPLTYDLDTAPLGMTIDATGLVAWVPLIGQSVSSPVRVRGRDGRGGAAAQPSPVTLLAQAPTPTRSPSIISPPPLVAAAGRPYAYDLKAIDAEGDPLQ